MIKVALLGAGFMGSMHSTCYENLPNAQVVAVADIQKDKAKELAKKHGAKAFSNANSVFSRMDDVDLVDICLPTYMHAKYTVRAAKEGINILCEKPMSHKLRDAKRMVDAVNEAGVKFMVAHVIRFWPEYQLLKRYIDEKILGELKALSLTRVSPMPTWTWDNWILKEELSGGALADLHVHDADAVRYFCGEPTGVDSAGVYHDERGWDYVSTNYHYPDKSVKAEGGWNLPSGYALVMGYRAVFEKGALEFDTRLNPALTQFNEDGGLSYPEAPKVEVAATGATGGNISDLGGYFLELQYVVDTLEKGGDLDILRPEDSMNTVDVLNQEMRSAKKKLKK